MNPCLSPDNVLLAAAFSHVADSRGDPRARYLHYRRQHWQPLQSLAGLLALPARHARVAAFRVRQHSCRTGHTLDPARATPFTMPVTVMLSVLVAIMSMHERFDITPLLSFSHSQEKLL